MRHFRNILMISSAALVLAACGADDVASPGEGTLVPAPAPSPSPSPSPTPTPTPGTPATSCATGFSDAGVVGNYRVCRIPNSINADLTIPARAGTAYQINGRVDVGIDVGGATAPRASGRAAVLTIEPGTLIFANGGDADNDFLVVNRGSQLQAVGTEARPIIFTARENLTPGGVTDTSQGLWGGIILAGRAPISNCNATVPGGSAGCEATVEGTGNALYGGELPADSSGRMQYVQIRYSGVAISPNNELQGLTTAGAGSGTTISHVQIHNSADDGIEVFGGRNSMRYLVMTGTDDDALDTDVGHQGAFQFVLAIQRTGNGSSDPRGFEIDSNGSEDALPRTDFRVANYTLVQRLTSTTVANSAAIHLRGGTDGRLVNGVVAHTANSCLNIDAAQTVRAADAALQDNGAPVFNANYFACTLATGAPTGSTAAIIDDGNVTAAQITAVLTGAPSSGNVLDGTAAGLTGTFITAGPAAAVTPFNASTMNFTGSGFLVQTSYIGAVRDANDIWYRFWTCDSGFAAFGSGSSCTSLPN
ncbi:hypothetical protein ACFOMD_09830 [Sphingoaurantiacus capsulatus]|uniref:Lipoprotein n=1 Tax=Sphingoaurantiacus capsulatus TaxID=1771310 RepID=A0ABV7X9Q9_9SPHN